MPSLPNTSDEMMQRIDALFASRAPVAKPQDRPLIYGAQAQVDCLATPTAQRFPLSFTRNDGTVVQCGFGYVFGDAGDRALKIAAE